MTVSQDLAQCADMCRVGAKKTLDLMFAMGPRPEVQPDAMLWDQQTTRLQGQLNSFSALNSKLTALSVIEGLKDHEVEMKRLGDIAKNAQVEIAKIKAVSVALTKLAKVLDLGLAVLAAATAPNPATIAAVLKAGDAVAEIV